MEKGNATHRSNWPWLDSLMKARGPQAVHEHSTRGAVRRSATKATWR
jgi:hypothetical protein